MSTLSEIMEKLERLRHEKAVWEDINEHLGNCIDTETLEKKSNIVAVGCISSEVPQDIVQEFIDTIAEQQIVPLDEQIRSLEGLQVEETEDNDEEDKKPKQPSKKKKAKARKKIVAKPKAKKPQGIRAVPGQRRKAAAGD